MRAPPRASPAESAKARRRRRAGPREPGAPRRVDCAVMAARPLLLGWLVSRAAQLRFPKLFALTAALFVADLLVPDAIPFADELLLGLATALLASWRKRRTDGAPPPAP